MDYFPLFASLKAQPCLVVGGGSVAWRKARELLAAGARVTVNAPRIAAGLRELARAGDLSLAERPFDPALIARHLLVIAATDERGTNRQVAAAARSAWRLCNVVDDGEASSFIVPAVVDRAPLVIAMSSGGHAPLLVRLMRQQLERWLPARLGELARWAGRWRARARASLAQPSERRDFAAALLAGDGARALLRGDPVAADAVAAADLARRLATGQRPDTAGRAWLVGAGPGDPDLISVRGLRCLEQADVIIHDRLVAPELLHAARRDAEIIPVGKTGGRISTSQQAINEILLDRVRAGRSVCRLKGGDPFVFGRGGEEALVLAAAGLPFEVIPGITAASGCGAAAGIPLTHRGLARSVTLVSARGGDPGSGPDWRHLAAIDGTLVVYMGGERIAGIAAALMAAGRDPATPAAVIRAGTLPGQEIHSGDLGSIARLAGAGRADAATLLVVGATAALAAQLGGRVPAGGHTANTLPWSLPAPRRGRANLQRGDNP